jgi:hypothetical protein
MNFQKSDSMRDFMSVVDTYMFGKFISEEHSCGYCTNAPPHSPLREQILAAYGPGRKENKLTLISFRGTGPKPASWNPQTVSTL